MLATAWGHDPMAHINVATRLYICNCMHQPNALVISLAVCQSGDPQSVSLFCLANPIENDRKTTEKDTLVVRKARNHTT